MPFLLPPTWMSSCSSRLTPVRPPMSSQVTLGTSTTVSRSALGLDMPSAVLKWSWGTDMGRWVGVKQQQNDHECDWRGVGHETAW